MASPWFAVQNGKHIDIHVQVIPPGEAPRELTIASHVQEANARLIAAAPDLLQACEMALKVVDRPDAPDSGASPIIVLLRTQLRAAIAKTTG